MDYMNTVLLVVFSLALLGLIFGLIFKADFRRDILRNKSDNEATFAGFTIKGGVFYALFGVIVGGTIYFAIFLNKHTGNALTEDNLPKIVTAGNHSWIALDATTGKPVDLFYKLSDTTKIELEQPELKSLNYKLTVSKEPGSSLIKAVTRNDGFALGELEPAELNKFRVIPRTNAAEKPLNIRYKLTLGPFTASRVTNDPLYDWPAYGRLPFTIEPSYSPENGMYLALHGESVVDTAHVIHKDFRTAVYQDDNAYIIWSVSSITNDTTGLNNHVHLRIMKVPTSCAL